MSKRIVEMMSFSDCDGVLLVDAAGASFLSAYRREMVGISARMTKGAGMLNCASHVTTNHTSICHQLLIICLKSRKMYIEL